MKMKNNPGLGLTMQHTSAVRAAAEDATHDDAVEDVTLLRHNVHRAAHGISEFRIVGKSVACGIRT